MANQEAETWDSDDSLTITPEDHFEWTGESDSTPTHLIKEPQQAAQEPVNDVTDTAPEDIVPEDFDPAEEIQRQRIESDNALLEAGAEPCPVCGKPIEERSGCKRCTVPASRWAIEGWGHTRHLPDRIDAEYVSLLSSFGYDDHEMITYKDEYLLAIMAYYNDFTPQDFTVAHYLFSVCEKSGRVVDVSYSAVERATGVARTTLRGREGRTTETVLDRLERVGVTESFGAKQKGEKLNLYLRLTWNPQHKIGIDPARRDEVYRMVMMSPEQKSNYNKKKKNSAKKAKLRKGKGK